MNNGIIGKTWSGRDIGYVKIGTGLKKVLLIGGFSAADDISPKILSDWADKAELCYEKHEIFGDFRAASLFANITVYVVARLNPDGAAIRTKPDMFDPFYLRTENIKKNYPDREWTANARGIDLSKNFSCNWIEAKMKERRENTFTPAPSGYGGEFPESEMETASLCGFIRKTKPDFICVFSNGEDGIYIGSGANVSANVKQKAAIISKLKGLRFKEQSESDLAATLPLWAKAELDIPAFSVGIQKADDFARYTNIITLSCAI